MISNKLYVHLYGIPLGILEQNSKGKMQFSYIEGASYPISLSMPLKTRTFEHAQCQTYFSHLLPEKPYVRQTICQLLKMQDSTFNWLRALGEDCPGAISFHHEPQVKFPDSMPISGNALTSAQLAYELKHLAANPLFVRFSGVRVLLGGVQDKVAVCIKDNQVLIPQGCLTTHILKPGIGKYKDLIKNEYFCMTLAHKLGLTVPVVELKQAQDIPYLLVKRIDREITTDNQILSIHQENFCSANGLASLDKGQTEGGLGLKECFHLLQKTVIPAIERNRLMEIIIFNYLLGNIHAHAKHFSLKYSISKDLSLGPFRDLSSTAYSVQEPKMAMRIASKRKIMNVYPHDWEQLCQEMSYSYVALKRMIQHQIEQMTFHSQSLREQMNEIGQSDEMFEKIGEFIDEQCERTLLRFQTASN